MGVLAQVTQAFWILNIGVQLGLLSRLVARRQSRLFPAFSVYLLVNLLQSALFLLIFPGMGAHSRAAWRLGWASQAVVILARSLAVAEICRGVLAAYRGIWALVWRLLLAVGAAVLLIAVALGKHDLRAAVITLDAGTEIAIAAVIAALFAFARYYKVPVDNPLRMMGVAFCVFSCASVVNNLCLQRFWTDYARIWNLVGTGTFLLALLLWTWALRQPARSQHTLPALLDARAYSAVIPATNRRLAELNEALTTLWNVNARRAHD